MYRSTLIAAFVAVVSTAATPGFAQERHRVVTHALTAPPLTVTKRSWLDSGNVVAVGTQNSYLAQSTTLNQPIYGSYDQAKFGQSALPGQFDLAFSNENPRGPQPGSSIFEGIQ